MTATPSFKPPEACPTFQACDFLEQCSGACGQPRTMPKVHDCYKQLETQEHMEACPVCGSDAQLWQYSDSETSPVERLVACSHGEPIGPQYGIKNAGCLLYMPPEAFHRATAREAIKYWNEFAKALQTLRRGNNWDRAKTLRKAKATASPLPS